MKNDIENDILNKINFFCFQRLMKNINFYAKIFKNCDERVYQNNALNYWILNDKMIILLRTQSAQTNYLITKAISSAKVMSWIFALSFYDQIIIIRVVCRCNIVTNIHKK